MTTDEYLEVVGARTHNLRNVDVRVPRGRIVAFTGVSGSGKSSLAIDTIHAEAQLRYLEGLAPFVRQYITPKDRPQVDRITGLTATLAVDQRKLNRSSRSTVATMTGLDAYLGLVFSRLPTLSGDVEAELTTASFDRHNPAGACPVCHGSGGSLHADPALIVTEPGRSLLDGASPWFGTLRTRSGATFEQAAVPALAEHHGVDLELPWRDLPAGFRSALLDGTGDEPIRVSLAVNNTRTSTEWTMNDKRPLAGAVAEIERLFAAAATETAKQRYLRFLRRSPCPACGGTGFGEPARTVMLGGRTYLQLVSLPVVDVQRWCGSVTDELEPVQKEVGAVLIAEIDQRLRLLDRLGLGHVALSRTAPSLSGGELQRARVAAQLGTSLTGIVYVLDEPGAGLHPADREKLHEVVVELRDAGNTVLLVEHDPALIARADWVVDIGPRAGTAGGRLVAAGRPADIVAVPESLTGHFLSVTGPRVTRRPRDVAGADGWLTLDGITVHNVRDASVRVPLGRLTCLTGVSGSGKSSVLHHALGASLGSMLAGGDPVNVASITGAEHIGWSVLVDQDPIGRTPRSNPATYTKAFDHIRALFAASSAALDKGLTAGAFSFNAAGGRCETCGGHGRRQVDMHFLPDIWVTCEACRGRRFGPDVLSVRYRGVTIDEVLEASIEEAAGFFTEPAALTTTLATLCQVGLGYLTLGQSATELSGGEAQRLKLAAAMVRSARRSAGNGIVLLDEPVTGLHPADVARLVSCFDTLLDQHTTVVAAEHDLHLAAAADWLVDLGPGGGAAGGRVVNEGTVADVLAGPGPTMEYLRGILH